MRYVLFALVLLGTLAPTVAFAGPFNEPIFPAECSCEGGAPAYGCVLETIQNVIAIGIAIGFIMATLALMYAGFVWMTSGGNSERRSKGKTMIMNVIVGIVVILAAWLVVDFVMKTLYDESGEFGPWNDILAGEGASANRCLVATKQIAVTSGSIKIVLNAVGSSSGVSTAGTVSDQEARSRLAAGGVNIHNWAATKTLANTRIDTINQAIAIKAACNCQVLVTATTGGAHAGGPESHAAGYKIDLEDVRSLNVYLMNALTRDGSRGSDPRYRDSCGNEYILENPGQGGNPGPKGSHWDITVNKGACALPSR
jgi:hypothetical protein